MKTKVKTLPSQRKLKEDFTYNPDTGEFIRYDGYTGCLYKYAIVFHYERENYYAHRLIWKYVTGKDPNQIDHLNGDFYDNRWKNLRESDQATNNRNRGQSRNNSSGYTGVDFNKKSNKWRARVCCNKKSVEIGLFNCPTAAFIAKLEWVKENLPNEFTQRHLQSNTHKQYSPENRSPPLYLCIY